MNTQPTFNHLPAAFVYDPHQPLSDVGSFFGVLLQLQQQMSIRASTTHTNLFIVLVTSENRSKQIHSVAISILL